jgi:hypothetical protein
MSATYETLPVEQSVVSQPEASAPAEVAPRSLAIVVDEIRRDCLVEPKRYLDEISVPFGGE